MKPSEFIRKQLSESDGQPSNNRVMLFLFLTTIMIMVLTVTIVPIFKPVVIKLPDIPPSFETFVEWVVGILVFGSATGKGINAYKAVKGAPDVPANQDVAAQ
jgi:nitrate reductase NapE component